MLEKYAAADRVKLARYVGEAVAYRNLGFSPEKIKYVFQASGFPEEVADDLVKEAGPWDFFARIFQRAGKGIAARLGSKTEGAAGGSWTSKLMKGPVPPPKPGTVASVGGRTTEPVSSATQAESKGFGNWMGNKLHNTGLALQTSAQGMAEKPLGTLWQGAKNFGSGALFMGGGGTVGGRLGQGTFAYNIGSSLFGGSPEPAQQPMGGMPNPVAPPPMPGYPYAG